MTIRNPILATDSYKFSHYMQYPEGARVVSSTIEARGTTIECIAEVVLYGVQAFIREVLSIRVTMQHVREAAIFCAAHGTPFNYEGWERIVKVHGGFIPVRIQAVPEGTPIPLKHTMVQVKNTDEELPWVTSYIETLLISYVWYGSTVATLSRAMKQTIIQNLMQTADDPDAEILWKVHDFGYRGVAAGAAGLGASAHLVNFRGTDTVEGITFAMDNYDADVCGFSISASEHSTMTSWGREREYEAYANMVEKYAKPGAMFACVIDSYDTLNAVRLWCEPQGDNPLSLLDMVKAAGAKVILRPDSGDPIQMPIDVIKEIAKYTGYSANTKGFYVLPDHVRVIQGDGIDHEDITEILNRLAIEKISGSNIGFGMGGGLLQKVNRDTFKFAMKANAINIDGTWHDVVKDPITDAGKKSKGGVQCLLRNKETGAYMNVRADESGALRLAGWYPVMQTVYTSSYGQVEHYPISFDEVRENAKL